MYDFTRVVSHCYLLSLKINIKQLTASLSVFYQNGCSQISQKVVYQRFFSNSC